MIPRSLFHSRPPSLPCETLHSRGRALEVRPRLKSVPVVSITPSTEMPSGPGLY